MAIVVPAIGLLIIVIGIAVLIAPGSLKRLLAYLAKTDRFYIAALLRIIFGILFLLAAGETRWPAFVTVVGVFMIFAGVWIPIVGGARIKKFAKWWIDRGNAVIRLWAVLAMGFGAVILYGGGAVKEVTTTITINASVDRVWSVLTEFDRYPEWNPFMPEVEGEFREGARLRVRIEPPGGDGMTFTPTMVHVLPKQEFRWLGRLALPGAFDGEHIFEIFYTQDGRVRFVHREEFRGFLVPLLWNMLDTQTREGFEAMNAAVKKRAETP